MATELKLADFLSEELSDNYPMLVRVIEVRLSRSGIRRATDEFEDLTAEALGMACERWADCAKRTKAIAKAEGDRGKALRIVARHAAFQAFFGRNFVAGRAGYCDAAFSRRRQRETISEDFSDQEYTRLFKEVAKDRCPVQEQAPRCTENLDVLLGHMPEHLRGVARGLAEQRTAPATCALLGIGLSTYWRRVTDVELWIKSGHLRKLQEERREAVLAKCPR